MHNFLCLKETTEFLGSNGLAVKTLGSKSRGLMFEKPLGGSKVDSALHPSKVNKMSTKNFWELNAKK